MFSNSLCVLPRLNRAYNLSKYKCAPNKMKAFLRFCKLKAGPATCNICEKHSKNHYLPSKLLKPGRHDFGSSRHGAAVDDRCVWCQMETRETPSKVQQAPTETCGTSATKRGLKGKIQKRIPKRSAWSSWAARCPLFFFQLCVVSVQLG